MLVLTGNGQTTRTNSGNSGHTQIFENLAAVADALVGEE
jgi:D-glycero-D-manno-heptose 1,7-bisphosphate phosphatase